jgi:hypothetical protein
MPSNRKTLADTRDRFDDHTCICTAGQMISTNATRASSAALTNACRLTANSTLPILHGRWVTFGIPISIRSLVMIATVRFGTLVGLLVFCVACDAQRPTAPSATLDAPTAPTPPAPPSGPSLSGPSITYHFIAPLDYPVRSFTPTSRYVLYNNGAFSLRYEALGEVAYTGRYRQEDGRFIFDFGADGVGSQLGGPDAIATLNGDLLEVRYSFEMRVGADFENAVYQRNE